MAKTQDYRIKVLNDKNNLVFLKDELNVRKDKRYHTFGGARQRAEKYSVAQVICPDGSIGYTKGI